MLAAAHDRASVIDGATPVDKQRARRPPCRGYNLRRLGQDVGFESRFERIDLINRPGPHALDNARQFRQGHEHSRDITAVRTIGVTRDVSEAGCREQVFDSSLCGLGDFLGYLAKRNRFSTEALDRQRIRGGARFVRNSKTQAFKVRWHA
jgi:hypothetical protein